MMMIMTYKLDLLQYLLNGPKALNVFLLIGSFGIVQAYVCAHDW
jgi:hypothetical protein